MNFKSIPATTHHSDSTEYSDWSPDGRTFKPPTRQAARKKRTISKSKWNKFLCKSKHEEEEEEEEEDELEQKLLLGDEEEEEDDGGRKRGVRAGKEDLLQGSCKKPQVFKSSDEDGEASNVPLTATMTASMTATRSGLKGVKEVPPEFRPPDWLTTSVPTKAPYFPQIGDEVIYFRQGHQLYVDAVRSSGAYNIDQSTLPCHKLSSLRVRLPFVALFVCLFVFISSLRHFIISFY